MKENQKYQFLPALLLFTVFAVGVLAVLLGGTQLYKRLTDRSHLVYNSRTCAQYLRTQVRQATNREAVSVAPFGEGDALVIQQRIEGRNYLTRIYCHDGNLMELFTGETGDFSPEDGKKILPAKEMTLSLEEGLLTISLTDSSGQSHKLFLQLQKGVLS